VLSHDSCYLESKSVKDVIDSVSCAGKTSLCTHQMLRIDNYNEAAPTRKTPANEVHRIAGTLFPTLSAAPDLSPTPAPVVVEAGVLAGLGVAVGIDKAVLLPCSPAAAAQDDVSAAWPPAWDQSAG
jgi:hypothetical protein